LALDIADGGRRDISVYDLKSNTLRRLTSTGVTNGYPVWTPDGQRIVYSSQEKNGANNLYTLWWIRADGAGSPQRLAESKTLQYTPSWHPNGKIMAFRQDNADTGWDIMTLSIEGDEKSGWKSGEPKPFVNSASDERTPAFSPDGRWLAYVSNETGRYEVWVRPFPGPGGKWQISTDGGYFPKWSPDNKLFYGADDNKIMVATYSTSGDVFQAGKPQLWSAGQFTDRGDGSYSFDLQPGSKRFAVVKAPGRELTRLNNVVFIFNFFDELRRIAPISKK
jgi:serine/threonine-protein kinase